MRIGDLRVETNGDHYVFEVEVSLNNLDPHAVQVELYADGIDGGNPIRVEMKSARTEPDPSRRSVYRTTLPSSRPAEAYTARIIPNRSGAAVPLECSQILWQH